MKKTIFIFLFTVIAAASALAQTDYVFTEASDLTLFGKVFPDTPKPYERMDFERFGDWTPKDVNLLEMSSGIAVSFVTDSPVIAVKVDFKDLSQRITSSFADRGFDLYIKDGKLWRWAGVAAFSPDKGKAEEVHNVVRNMDGSMKECILYLPTFSKENSVKIATAKGSRIEKGEIPFRHRVCLHGSSFMHGASTGRSGLTVPGFLSRWTGIQFCSLGVSGDCRMQPNFAKALKEAEVDAFVFDAFSNGDEKTVEQNMFNFIRTIQEGHPGKPLIFVSTIWRERRNFDLNHDKAEAKKIAVADSLIKIAVKEFKDVYYVKTSCAADPTHDTTIDGVHPSDHGYYLWAESIRKPVLKILKKYGIK